MKPITVSVIALAGILAGFVAKGFLENEQITALLHAYASHIVVGALIGLALVFTALVAAYLLIARFLRSKLKTGADDSDVDMLKGVVDSFTNIDAVENPSSDEQMRSAQVSLGLFYLRSRMRGFYFSLVVSIGGGMVGLATVFLLSEQNRKLEIQNERIKLQTEAGIIQSVLVEATRRAALGQEMANLFQDIRDESEAFRASEAAGEQPAACASDSDASCAETVVRKVRGSSEKPMVYRASENLQRRIRSFSLRNTPFRIASSTTEDLEFSRPLSEQYTFINISPERGQLLETLISARIAAFPFDFSFAQLQRSPLEGAVLHRVNLENADLRHASLNFSYLVQTYLRGANLAEAFVTGADLRQVNLRGEILVKTAFTGSNLDGADLTGALISGTVFSTASVAGADFKDVWAWQDEQPIDLPPGIAVYSCSFDAQKHDRFVRPDECKTKDTSQKAFGFEF